MNDQRADLVVLLVDDEMERVSLPAVY